MWPDDQQAHERDVYGMQVQKHKADAEGDKGGPVPASGAAAAAFASDADRQQDSRRRILCGNTQELEAWIEGNG
jgi:hypothetical protein